MVVTARWETRVGLGWGDRERGENYFRQNHWRVIFKLRSKRVGRI